MPLLMLHALIVMSRPALLHTAHYRDRRHFPCSNVPIYLQQWSWPVFAACRLGWL